MCYICLYIVKVFGLFLDLFTSLKFGFRIQINVSNQLYQRYEVSLRYL